MKYIYFSIVLLILIKKKNNFLLIYLIEILIIIILFLQNYLTSCKLYNWVFVQNDVDRISQLTKINLFIIIIILIIIIIHHQEKKLNYYISKYKLKIRKKKEN